MVRLALFTLDDGECADAAWVMLDHHFTVKPEVSHDGRETAVYIYTAWIPPHFTYLL